MHGLNEHAPDQTRPTPTELARQQYGTTARRRTWLPIVIVAFVSLAVGAGGVLLVLRAGWFGTAAPGKAHGASTEATAAAQTGAGGMPGMPGMNSGTATRPADASDKAVYISPARQQLIGVRTAPVTSQVMDTTIRTVGVLAYDETRITQINTKIAGWVERLYVDYVGKPVRRGQPLFSVYSPELVATQNEYLLALRARAQLGSSQIAETRNSSASLLAATRERLKLWDISDAQVAELERTKQPRKSLTLYAPFDGIVLERNAFAGQYITPEMATFKLADLSTIWVVAQVFEYEMRSINIGQVVDIQFPYGEYARTIKGRVSFIYPDIDPLTRRGRIRIEFANPGLALKPGTYVTTSLRTGGGRAVALPKEAVIDTGTKQYAIVALANGYFEPRPITIGQPTDQSYPVLAGVNEGDRVVTSAQFLIDSEANLQDAMKAMSMSMPGMEMGGGGDMKGMDMGGGKGKGKTQGQPPQKQPQMQNMPGMEKTPGMQAPAPGAPAKKREMQGMPGMEGMPPMTTPPKKPTAAAPKKKSGGQDQQMDAPSGMDDMPGMDSLAGMEKAAPKKTQDTKSKAAPPNAPKKDPKDPGGAGSVPPAGRIDSKEPGL